MSRTADTTDGMDLFALGRQVRTALAAATRER
jgi:hypothetical protein